MNRKTYIQTQKKRMVHLKKYRVNVCRIAYGNLDIEVMAPNKKLAQRSAEESAGNYSFTEHTSEYQAQSVMEIKES